MSEYCECPKDIANTNAPMGGCTVCRKVTKRRAIDISYEYHRGEKEKAKYRLSELEFIQANKQSIIRVIDFYLSEYGDRFSSKDLNKLVVMIDLVPSSISAENQIIALTEDSLNYLKTQQHICLISPP